MLPKEFHKDELFSKPAKWFKIYFYLVSISKEETVKTCYADIMWWTNSTKHEVDHCMRWLREHEYIATEKATGGVVVDILKHKEMV